MHKLPKNRLLGLALLVVAAVVCPAQVVTFTEYPVPTAGGFPREITAGPDGNLWFTESNVPKIGRITTTGVITEFSVQADEGITVGPDGNLWFTEYFGQKIGRITTTGVITEFSLPNGGSYPVGITAGSDGNLWFTEVFGNRIGKITTAGVITEFPIPTANSGPLKITAGPDGNLWFTECNCSGGLPPGGNKIGRITTAGVITEFPIPTANSAPLKITAGPDGNLWFTEAWGNKIGRITTAGMITEFPIPTAGSAPAWITPGPDGNLWFTEDSGNQIGRITTAGVITEFPVPTPASRPNGITTGPDGNLWFTEGAANKIVKANIPSTPPTIRPATGGNAGSVTVQITGSGFQSGATVKLTGVGSDILGANTTIPSAFFLTTTFNLVGAAPGPRTVVITNPDSTFLSLAGAFTVEQGGASDVRIQKIGTPAVPGRNVTYFVTVQNVGTVDANNLDIVELIDSTTLLLIGATPAPVASIDSLATASMVSWTISTLPPEQPMTFAYTARVYGSTPTGSIVSGPVCVGPDEAAALFFCLKLLSRAVLSCFVCVPLCSAISSCTTIVSCLPSLALCSRCVLGGPNAVLGGPIGGCGPNVVDAWGCMNGLPTSLSCDRHEQTVRGSVDPNDLIGPPGHGSQRWIPGGQPMPYGILFENPLLSG